MSRVVNYDYFVSGQSGVVIIMNVAQYHND